MTSLERKERRYKRSNDKRLKKLKETSEKYADLDNAFCFHKAMYYGDKCCNNVGYKKSTQNFKLHEFTIISNICKDIKTNNYKVGDTYNFIINERGKIRNIQAPHIKDRLVHKILCNEIIVPIYTRHLIYDNGASMKGKGYKFSMDRLKKMLYSWYLKNKTNGYVMIIDFSKFFENCSHEVIHNIHKKYIFDDKVIKVIEDYLFISKGISLGIEIAQMEAIMIPNTLDHFVENKTKLIRYMDDTVVLIYDYKEGKELLEKYNNICNLLSIKINIKKSFISRVNKTFKYCKWRYKLLNNGKVICIPCIKTIRRQRIKLRKMAKFNIDKREIEITSNSYKAYLSLGNTYRYISRL